MDQRSGGLRVDSYANHSTKWIYLHVSVRQQLPKFGPGRWEAIADCDNLLAQGYVTVNTGKASSRWCRRSERFEVG
jgi:hypothetical protein